MKQDSCSPNKDEMVSFPRELSPSRQNRQEKG